MMHGKFLTTQVLQRIMTELLDRALNPLSSVLKTDAMTTVPRRQGKEGPLLCVR
jgi:hypothetical protein